MGERKFSFSVCKLNPRDPKETEQKNQRHHLIAGRGTCQERRLSVNSEKHPLGNLC